VFFPAAALTMYAMMKSQRLYLFLDAVADPKVGFVGKADALIDVWRGKPHVTR